MEHMAKHRERQSTSSRGCAGTTRKGSRAFEELVGLIGLPATLELVREKGGTTFTVPLGMTYRGQEQREKLVQLIGREQTTTLIGHYGGTSLYVPLCRQIVVDKRDVKINRERDELARQGLSERALVRELATRHGLSDRQIWRILKRVLPASSGKGPVAERMVSSLGAGC